MTELPRLNSASMKELRAAMTRATAKYSSRGTINTGKRAPKPITLRLAPEKR